MISEIFIRRPIFASVISIVIVILGSVAMVALPIARYPEIAPPTVEVKAVYPGASAETVAETVAAPLEREINGVENMLYLSSNSASDGSMTLTVTFEVGTDIDMATVLVQNRVSIAEAGLPEEVKREGISTKKKSTEITLFLSLFSPDGSRDASFLNNYAVLNIDDEIRRVAGVGDTIVFGSGEYSMRVWLDPDRLQFFGLTTNDVVNAIREQNVQVAAGQIGREPAPEGTAQQLTVSTLGRLTRVDQFENIIVKTGDDGSIVRVSDLASVELGSHVYDLGSATNGQASAVIAVYQLPGSNALDVADGVRATLDALSEGFPEGVEYRVAYDSTQIIRASIREVVITLFITLVLVIITVYVFLQSFRATLIPAATIPVSLIGTFAVMLALGFSINLLTMFGLVLVIGIVVDDAIVVVENVTRHLDEGQTDRKQAAIDSMREVTGPVIATTLVLLAVFIPTAFLPGITGSLFQQFALTIAIATVFSSINALTLSPALCGVLLRPSSKKPAAPFRAFNSALAGVTSAYAGVVRVGLRLAPVAVIAAIGLFVLTGVGFSRLPQGFVPQEDEGWCIVNVQLPDGASLQRTEEVVQQVEAILRSEPMMEDIVSITGFSLIEGANASNMASLLGMFADWDARSDPSQHQTQILRRLNMQFSQIQDAIVMAFVQPSLPGLGNSGGLTMQLLDQGGTGLEALQEVASEFVQDGVAQSGIDSMYTGFRANVPQYFVDIDREQVKSMGIPLGDVFNTLQAYLGSAYVNDFTQFGRIYQVKLQADSRFRSRPEDILRLEVRNSRGQMIPLGTLVNVEKSFGPQTVSRFNVYNSAKIIAQPAPGYSAGDGMEILESMAGQKLPTSMGYAWADLAFQQKAASGSANVVFLFAIVLVYLVLAAQYESWTIPISVVLTVPLALLGAVLALMARGMDVNLYTQIGIVLLIGLAAKTSILIVEFAKQRHEEGLSVFDAALEAARLRFRAVLMTAFSFILGVIPLLIASGAGAESRKVLGTTVFGGMLIATVAGVVVAPVFFYVIQRMSGGSAKVTAQSDVTPHPEAG